jgi:hypothetical protein
MEIELKLIEKYGFNISKLKRKQVLERLILALK